MPKATIKKAPKSTKPLTEKDEAQKELDIASALEAVAVSKGGVIIQESLVSDIVGLVSTLAIKYKGATQLELVGLCADLKTKLDMLRVLSRAGKNKEFLIETLADALKE